MDLEGPWMDLEVAFRVTATSHCAKKGPCAPARRVGSSQEAQEALGHRSTGAAAAQAPRSIPRRVPEVPSTGAPFDCQLSHHHSITFQSSLLFRFFPSLRPLASDIYFLSRRLSLSVSFCSTNHSLRPPL